MIINIHHNNKNNIKLRHSQQINDFNIDLKINNDNFENHHSKLSL